MSGHARVLDAGSIPRLAVLGPVVELLSPIDGDADAPFLMRGTVPPGVVVPLHSHVEPETFLCAEGELEALVDGRRWETIRPGDVFHAPGGAPHAFRNTSERPATTVIATGAGIGRLFAETGTPQGTSPPPPEEDLARFLAAAGRRGDWIATPEENALVGIALPVAG